MNKLGFRYWAKNLIAQEASAFPRFEGNLVNSNRNDGPELIKPRGEEGGQADLFS